MSSQIQAIAQALLKESDPHVRRRMMETSSRAIYLPPIKEFITSPNYANSKLWPAVARLLELIDDPRVREFYLELAKGSGKSSGAAAGVVYAAARLAALKDPHEYFDIGKIKPITCLTCSTSETQAIQTIFAQVKSWVRQNPFFIAAHRMCAERAEFPFSPDDPKYPAYKIHTTAITIRHSPVFPDGQIQILCGHAKSEGMDGHDVFMAIIDESNKHGLSEESPQAQKLETTFRTSGFTRFPSDYKLGLISSSVSKQSHLRKEVDRIFSASPPQLLFH
ncbi:MAG: hypothetical protein UY48_C0003G0019 [Candidatus Gottesmanbacteria bacterium GW2011_GWB1_49_7]|uniref:Terminase large subunit n=1 Tax=Candidatus Gottesmanbacteria bacterium GW2011_GWB1_49_7 TaxID=1618448 RepID=A0A0G1YE20_9BACT|nr:MAG: hypothetical protein UY48_C0003G0019 [Candidatus Gottesmanbacteria bacterium GW2011_GWB1_49_7]